MAQQEEPLYDFPEPTQPSKQTFLGHQRERGSLKSISVLDRLLLTVPVWLQLSINPATALHILQREPPGTFLVRKSRTSQRNVLCVRLADDSVPSFVQQFGIRKEHSTLSLETSAISFPDLPRLISFYCVSRDVLPFPLELPEAIAKATSHKELESISHMGVEFWSSHLNVRGPREAPTPQRDKETKSDTGTSTSAAQPVSVPSGSPPAAPASDRNPTVFHEFCPITTRSPGELDCGSGLGALCFINPLFLQSQNALSRRRMFKRSLKVRVSTETSTLLSPPLAPPPPPPLLPKAKGKRKGLKLGPAAEGEDPSRVAHVDPASQNTHLQPLTQTQDTSTGTQVPAPEAPEEQEPGGEGALGDGDSAYMQPSPMITGMNPPSLSPYLSAKAPPMAPPPFLKLSPCISPHDSPPTALALSPYQSPSLPPKVPFSLSSRDSPGDALSLSPYQSPSPSPHDTFPLSPFTSLSPSPPPGGESCHMTAAPPIPEKHRSDGKAAEEDDNGDGDETTEERHKQTDEEEGNLVLQLNAAALNETDSCSSFNGPEGAAETHCGTSV